MSDSPANMRYVEVRLLRYAIAVAEELHFGRAAQRLHLSAPSLSKQIRQLERNLGYALFLRRTREVVLTQAGIAFIGGARQALSGIRHAVDRGAAASRSEADEVSVAYSPWLRPSQLSSVKAQIAQIDSRVSLRLISMQPCLQVDSLLSGTIDIGVVELPLAVQDITAMPITRDELVVAMPHGHPLSLRERVRFADLSGTLLVSVARLETPGLYDRIVDCWPTDRPPQVVQSVTNWFEMADLVASGHGVGVMTKSASQLCPPGLVVREFESPPPIVQIGVIYCENALRPSLNGLIQQLLTYRGKPIV